MKLSIIVPLHFYNIYTIKMLQSLAMQQNKNFEIVCVGNAVTEQEFEAIVQKIKALLSGSNIEQNYFYTSATGANNARYVGYKNSKYNYIFFLDSDDQLASADSIGQLLNIVQKYQPDVISVNIRRAVLNNDGIELKNIIYSFKEPGKLLTYPKNKKLILKNYGTNIVGRVIKKACLNDINFLTLPFFQDWNITTKLFPNLQTFLFINEPLYVYTRRESSISNFSNMQAKDLSNAFNCLKDFNEYFEKHNFKKSYRQFITTRSIKFGVAYTDRCNLINFLEGKKMCKEYFRAKYPFKIEYLFSKLWFYYFSIQYDSFSVLFSKMYKLKKIISLRLS